MNDKELDKLIKDSFERDAMLEEINRRVMRQINRSERRITAQRLARMTAVAFGTPLVVLGGVWGIYKAMANTDSKLVFAFLAVSALILISSAAGCVAKFSSEKL